MGRVHFLVAVFLFAFVGSHAHGQEPGSRAHHSPRFKRPPPFATLPKTCQLFPELALTSPALFEDGHLSERSESSRPVEGGFLPWPEPTTYGLFVGVRHGSIRGDLDAESMRHKLIHSKALIKPGNEILLTGNYEERGVANIRIEKAIQDLKSRLQPGDKLIVFLSAHGFSEPSGDEHSETRGDEYLAFSKASHFTDDHLSSLLVDMDEVEKWVMIDACRSGGFWTANSDEGRQECDIGQLRNVSFFAAAGEAEDCYADEAGRGYFTAALIKAFDSEEGLTFDALEHAVRQSAIGDGLDERPSYLRSLGDIVDLPVDTWAPVAFKSEDFAGTLGSRGIAKPAHTVFLVCGLTGLVAYRRMFRHK